MGTAHRVRLAALRSLGSVIRGAAGLFADVLPGTIASAFDSNSPLRNSFVTTGPFAPGVAGNASVADLGNPQFGYSIRTVSTLTRIFGSFLVADASPRALQIRAQLTF